MKAHAMHAALAYVAAHPGCTMRECARAIAGRSPSVAKGYNPINRALRAGWLAAVPLGRDNARALYLGDRVPMLPIN